MANPAGSVVLVPIDLHNQIQFDELLRQRIICGWENTLKDLLAWREQADSGRLSVFWITTPSSLQASTCYLGHVTSTSRTDDQGRPVQHIAQLFILPERRSVGLGKAAVRALEAEAQAKGCKALTLNCINRRYIDDDSSDEWRPFATRVYTKMGLPMPGKGTSNEAWYAKMGFVKITEKPAYPTGEYREDGSEILFIACDMKKEL